MEIVVLIDYDNIQRLTQNKGLLYISERIVDLIGYDQLSIYRRIRLRLYGGWYEQNTPTRKAQNLQSEILINFPHRSNVVKEGKTHSIIVVIELAFSMILAPNKHLFSTYRIRGHFNNINCIDPRSIGCTDPSCPLTNVYDFVRHGKCSKHLCNIKPRDLFYKNEQKLVDAMMLCDFLYLNGIQNLLILVTSDDDFWPGIQTALILGSSIIHIHTKKRAVPRNYSDGFQISRYTQIFL